MIENRVSSWLSKLLVASFPHMHWYSYVDPRSYVLWTTIMNNPKTTITGMSK